MKGYFSELVSRAKGKPEKNTIQPMVPNWRVSESERSFNPFEAEKPAFKLDDQSVRPLRTEPFEKTAFQKKSSEPQTIVQPHSSGAYNEPLSEKSRFADDKSAGNLSVPRAVALTPLLKPSEIDQKSSKNKEPVSDEPPNKAEKTILVNKKAVQETIIETKSSPPAVTHTIEAEREAEEPSKPTPGLQPKKPPEERVSPKSQDREPIPLPVPIREETKLSPLNSIDVEKHNPNDNRLVPKLRPALPAAPKPRPGSNSSSVEKRLVIGKLNVEVLNPPVLQQRANVRPSRRVKNSQGAIENSGRFKLRFGLGQV